MFSQLYGVLVFLIIIFDGQLSGCGFGIWDVGSLPTNGLVPTLPEIRDQSHSTVRKALTRKVL